MEFFPMYVDEPQNKEPGDIIKNTDWNNLFNLLMTQGNHNTDALLEISQTYPTTAQMETAIAQQIIDIGTGDMAKAVYDTNNDGVVDVAETVVDGGITTDKIANNAINENKLSDFLLQYIQTAYTTAIDKSRVKFGSIADLTPSSTQQGTTTTDITINDYATYDIGFTPKVVIIFDIARTYNDDYYYNIIPRFGTYYTRSSSTNHPTMYTGGIAIADINNGICMGFPSPYPRSYEVFRIVSNGFKIHNYKKLNDTYVNPYTITLGNSYYLAIG